jgi:hypothetical protein
MIVTRLGKLADPRHKGPISSCDGNYVYGYLAFFASFVQSSQLSFLSSMAANSVLVNDVPMQGRGFYSSHSELQHAAMLEALPLLRAAASSINVHSKQMGRLTVAEYGSAHGNNS